jgi:hypothetical protein
MTTHRPDKIAQQIGQLKWAKIIQTDTANHMQLDRITWFLRLCLPQVSAIEERIDRNIISVG